MAGNFPSRNKRRFHNPENLEVSRFIRARGLSAEQAALVGSTLLDLVNSLNAKPTGAEFRRQRAEQITAVKETRAALLKLATVIESATPAGAAAVLDGLSEIGSLHLLLSASGIHALTGERVGPGRWTEPAGGGRRIRRTGRDLAVEQRGEKILAALARRLAAELGFWLDNLRRYNATFRGRPTDQYRRCALYRLVSLYERVAGREIGTTPSEDLLDFLAFWFVGIGLPIDGLEDAAARLLKSIQESKASPLGQEIDRAMKAAAAASNAE